MRTPGLRGLLFAAFVHLSVAVPVFAQEAAIRSIDVQATPITGFRIGSAETRFGKLEYVGGFSISASSREFGQLSAFRFLHPGGPFLAVADHGYWISGAVTRDESGVPVGVEGVRMESMVDDHGLVIEDKAAKDAEGLEIRDGIATVAFEREARVSEYRIDPAGMGPPLRHLDIVIPRNELRYNQGIETVTRTHEGARIVIAERSIDANGDIFAAILEGPEKGVFKVRRSDGYDITDGALMPDGDILVLERRFSVSHGVGMRLRRLAAETIRKGSLADGPVLMEANLAYQIDNMEALDVWRRDDGALMISMLSDDNQSFLQRTLYLEFRLVE